MLSVLGPERDGFGTARKSDICLATSPDGVCDYTGNDDGVEDVIHIYNALTRQRQVFAVSRDSHSDVSPFLHDTLGDTHMLYCAPEAFFGRDIDGDGEIGTGDVCVLMDDADNDFTLDADGSGKVSDSCLEEPNFTQVDSDARRARGSGLRPQLRDAPGSRMRRRLRRRHRQGRRRSDPRRSTRPGRRADGSARPGPGRPDQHRRRGHLRRAHSSAESGACGLLGVEALLPLALLSAGAPAGAGAGGSSRTHDFPQVRDDSKGKGRSHVKTLKLWVLAAVGACFVLTSSQTARALSLSLSAAPPAITSIGQTVLVDLNVAGVKGSDGGGTLRGYDIVIDFDPSVLSLTSGDITLNLDAVRRQPQRRASTAACRAGTAPASAIFVSLGTLSDAALRAMQTDAFQLAQLSFTSVSVPVSTTISFGDPNDLTGLDGFSDPLVGRARARLVEPDAGSGARRREPVRARPRRSRGRAPAPRGLIDPADAGRSRRRSGRRRSALTSYQRRLLVFLSVATFFEGYDVIALSQILPNLRADLGLSKATGGLLIAGANAGAIAAWWLVRRADWWGRRRTLAVTIAGYTLFTFATAFAVDALSFGLLQFLARAFLLAEWEISLIYAAEEFPADRRGLMIGVIQAFSALGSVLCAVAAPLLLATPFGWRAVYGVAIVPLALLAWARRDLRETRRFEQQVLARRRRARAGRLLRRAARALAPARVAARGDLVPQLLLHAERDGLLEGVRDRRARLERCAGGRGGGPSPRSSRCRWSSWREGCSTSWGASAVRS